MGHGRLVDVRGLGDEQLDEGRQLLRHGRRSEALALSGLIGRLLSVGCQEVGLHATHLQRPHQYALHGAGEWSHDGTVDGAFPLALLLSVAGQELLQPALIVVADVSEGAGHGEEEAVACPLLGLAAQLLLQLLYNLCVRDALVGRGIAECAKPGQFVDLYSSDKSRLLPRPISLCGIDKENGILRLVYRIAGAGTKEFSALSAGHTIDVLGPLGNGFTPEGKKAIIIGGGIGIPPMLQLAKSLDCEKSIVLGYRDEEFLSDEFKPYGDVYMSSDTGFTGVKGTVMDAIREYGITGDIIYACGPTPMLRAVRDYALENGIKAQLSLEERMACGVGACLACVCKSTDIDDHSKVNNKRVCKDGPVFYAEEVEL